MAEILDKSAPTVHHHAARLEEEDYVQRVEGTSNPILYEKGAEGKDLDKVIAARNLGTNIRSYATGVTSAAEDSKGEGPDNTPEDSDPTVKQPSKGEAEIPKAKVHHLKFKLKVNKVGDKEVLNGHNGHQFQFLTKYFDRRNVERWKGKVPYEDKWVSVEYEETPNHQNFYIYPPELNLSADELNNYEEIAADICCKIAGYIQKHGGWDFGFPELTNWQRHVAVDSPELMKGIAEKYFVESDDGKTWSSSSEGRSEVETSDIEYAKVMLEMPGEVVSMKTEIKDLRENMQLIVDTLKQMEEAHERSARLNGHIVKDKVEEAVQEAQKEKSKAAAHEDFEEDYWSVMYQ